MFRASEEETKQFWKSCLNKSVMNFSQMLSNLYLNISASHQLSPKQIKVLLFLTELHSQ